MAAVPLVQIPPGSTIVADIARSLFWIGDSTGSLKSVSFVPDSLLINHQNVGFGIRSLAVGPTTTLAVIGTEGQILLLNLDDPSSIGQLLTLALIHPNQACFGPSADLLFVAEGSSDNGTLTTIDLQNLTKEEQSVTGVSGVTVLGDNIFHASNRGDDHTRGVLDALGNPEDLTNDLPPIAMLGALPDMNTILVAHTRLDKVSTYNLTTKQLLTQNLDGINGRVSEIHGLSHSSFAVKTDDTIFLFSDLTALGSSPFIEPLDDIFVGSWARIFFGIGDPILNPNDIGFLVKDDPNAAFVSFTKDDIVGSNVPLLVVNGLPGQHHLVMYNRSSGDPLATAIFTVTDNWHDRLNGPPGFATQNFVPRGTANWGGGPNTLQNFNTQPHSGTWRLLLMLVDTSSARWPDADIDPARQNIMDNVINGVTFDSRLCSVKRYYEENSANALTISAHDNRVFGVLNLPNAWETYFDQTKDETGTVTDIRWFLKDGSVLQTMITAAISNSQATTADFQAVDTVVFFPFSADAATVLGGRYAWPAQYDAGNYAIGDKWYERATFPQIYFTPDWTARRSRQMFTTLSHEVGHSLGLPDLYDFPEYSPGVKARIVDNWDIMALDTNELPHFSLSNKMRMGWVDPNSIRRFDFQISGSVSEAVTLRAAELNNLTGTERRGVEIRLGDGWNLYAEYRSAQTGAATDDLLLDRRVLITDVISAAYNPTQARPVVLFSEDDEDGDGHLLTGTDDLKQTDPGTQMQMTLKLLSVAEETANIHVTYSSGGRPEPGIRDWDGARSNWQSPDIEIHNVRADAEPNRFRNTPWLGHRNTIEAKVRNSGDLAATGVVVEFFVTEFTTGEGPWEPYGTATQDILPNDITRFTASREWWPPAKGGHFCVIARIRQYQDPADPLILDLNPWNNQARSNYTSFISASKSPSSRAGTPVNLSNPFDAHNVVFAQVRTQHPYHRVFTSHTWRKVPPKSQAQIKVWDESIYDTPEWHNLEQKDVGLLYKLPNYLSVEGHVERVIPSLQCRNETITGGVGIRVDAARATEIKIENLNRASVSGSVWFVDTMQRLGGGKLLFELWPQAAKSPEEAGGVVIGVDQLNSDGFFGFKFATTSVPEPKVVSVHYLGVFDAAPSETGLLNVR